MYCLDKKMVGSAMLKHALLDYSYFVRHGFVLLASVVRTVPDDNECPTAQAKA